MWVSPKNKSRCAAVLLGNGFRQKPRWKAGLGYEAVIFLETPFLVSDKMLAVGQFAQKSNATKTAASALPLTKQKTCSLYRRGKTNYSNDEASRALPVSVSVFFSCLFVKRRCFRAGSAGHVVLGTRII